MASIPKVRPSLNVMVSFGGGKAFRLVFVKYPACPSQVGKVSFRSQPIVRLRYVSLSIGSLKASDRLNFSSKPVYGNADRNKVIIIRAMKASEDENLSLQTRWNGYMTGLWVFTLSKSDATATTIGFLIQNYFCLTSMVRHYCG